MISNYKIDIFVHREKDFLIDISQKWTQTNVKDDRIKIIFIRPSCKI